MFNLRNEIAFCQDDNNLQKLAEKGILSKSFNTLTGSAGGFTQPQNLSPVLTQYVRKMPTLINAISHAPTDSTVVTWNAVTAPGSAIEALDMGTITVTDATLGQQSANVSFFYELLQLSNPGVAGSRYANLTEDLIGIAINNLMRKMGTAVFAGSSASNAGYVGLKSAITATSGASGQTANGATLSNLLAQQVANGYANPDSSAFVVGPLVYSLLMQVARQQVHLVNFGPGPATIGFMYGPINTLYFANIPVLVDYNCYVDGTHEDMYLVSLDPADLQIFDLVSLDGSNPGIQIEKNLQPSITTDSMYHRIKNWSVLVVKNPYAHQLLASVVIPALSAF